MSKYIPPFMLSIYFWLIVVSILIAGSIWYLGPLISIFEYRPLEDEMIRVIAIVSLAFLVVILVLLIMLRRRSRDAKLAEEIVEEGAKEDPGDAVAAAELRDVRDRMREALKILRKSKLGGRLGRRHLYQLPWYVMIGPPGAGKTTAIINSGLQFPLADRMGKSAVSGVGGTRNCDWWFTNEAVLIDTAGRYTTQDSDASADAKAWTGFLGLLKKFRKRQPINGALVAISLSDLSLQDDATRRSHAMAIRKRLRELRDRLNVRFPVYVLFTKTDLIAGFTEYFDNLGKEDRAQVWGFTLPVDDAKGDASAMANFDAEFDALVDHVNNRSLERMQQETDHQRRSLIHGFPQQIASLRAVAKEFLGEVFQDSRFEDRQLLRGVYFTSGTQEGTPIDRLMMGMARSFGIGRQAIGAGTGTARSYFLTRLLSDVVFGEAGLVSADDRVERRYRWIVRGAATVAALVVIGFGTLWTLSYLGNAALIENARAEVDRYKALVANIPGSPIEDTDIAAVVPALNILLDLPGNPAQGDPEPPMELTWGLYQGAAVGTEAAQTYRGALHQLLQPRLLLRLEAQMQASMNNPELLYEALKVYLMLGLQGPMDAALVRQWMLLDWSIAFPGDSNAQLRQDLAGHLYAMLNQPMKEIALNGPLVEQVQGILAETPLAQRIYNSIVKGPEAQAATKWRLIEAGGPATSRVLVRPSGEPLSEGVEGIYTHKGFHDVFLPEALGVAIRIQRESWALGPRGEVDQTPASLSRLTRDVMNLYYNDYIERWDSILGDIDIVPMESLSHAVEVTNVLSGPTSPIVNILKSVAEETWLTKLEGAVLTADVGANVGSTLASDIRSGLSSRTQALLAALEASSPALTGGGSAPEPTPGQYVEDRFAWLHQLVASAEGAPSQLDGLIATMTEVYSELNRLSVSPSGGAAINQATAGGAANRLLEATSRIQGPMQRWASQIAQGSSGIAAGGARAQLNAQWQTQVLPLCEKALNDRYPFNPKAEADVALQDFARLFSPSGMIDAFFTENLLPFVDTTATPWKWRRVNNADLGISASVLTQFQRAAEIRDSFFLGAGPPAVTFDLKPIALDPNATQVILEIEGQQLSYAHGPPQVTPLTWPGQAGGRSRVAFTPELPSTANSIMLEGPWAWFRLLDAAEVRRTNVSDRSRVIFNVGGRIAVFQMRAGSALNPFTLPALRSFRCVKSL